MTLDAAPPPDDHSIGNGPHPLANGIAHPGPATPGAGFPLKFSDLLLIFVLAIVAVQGVALLVGLAAAALGMDITGEDTIVTTLLSVLTFQAVALFAVIHFAVLRRRNLTWADLGLRPAPKSWYRKSLAAVALAIPLTWALNGLVQLILGRAIENPQLAALAPTGFTWAGLIGMLVLVGFVMPLAEEILFRGIFYRWLRDRMGMTAAAVVSGLCFSVLHGVPVLIPAILVLGVILALLYEMSGSLWPSVLAHALYNTISIVLLYSLLGADLPFL